MDHQAALGADEAVPVEKFSIYLADCDRDSAPVVAFEQWVEIAMNVLGRICRGVTRMPEATGMWHRKGRLIRERTVVVYSYILDPDHFDAEFEKIVRFIHTYGARTNQDAVLAERSGENLVEAADGMLMPGFINRAYFIERYDKAVPPGVAFADLMRTLQPRLLPKA